MRTRLAIFVVLGGLGVAAPARAQEADEYFRRGVAALRAGNHEAATTMFEKSYALQPRAATLCNLALAYDQWGGHEEIAAEQYGRCADEDGSGRFRAHARERERALREALAARAASTDSDTDVAPPPPEAPVAPPPAIPEARLGGDPARQEPAPPGWRRAPALAPQPTVVWRVPPAPARERSHTLAWVGLGSGLLGAGAIVAAFVTVQGVQSDADYLDAEYDGGDRPIRAGSADAELLDSARARSDFSLALYAAGGGLAALGVGLLLADLARGDGEAPAVSAAVAPVPGGALATFRGTVP